MRKFRIALLAEEFFDANIKGHGTFGGYGMLARHYIAEYLQNDEIEIEAILGFNDAPELWTTSLDGRKRVILLPEEPQVARRNLLSLVKRKGKRFLYHRRLRSILNRFDLFVSIETPAYLPFIFQDIPRKKLILYIQDPRPQSEWDDLDSVIRTDDGSPRPNARVRSFYNEMLIQQRLVLISQGQDLVEKAKDLYLLPSHIPVRLVRNPVQVNRDFVLGKQVKEDAVVFLGRLDPVKRPWLALEVARQMPHVQFYFLGKVHDETSSYIIYPYRHLKNVHLLGHQAGDLKIELLRKCKILLNTSIHEAIPVSFLEALACGTLIVSCQNPDDITSRFGAYTGKILADGRDQANLFVSAIQKILDDEPARSRVAESAIAYVLANHSIERWTAEMREIIIEHAKNRS